LRPPPRWPRRHRPLARRRNRPTAEATAARRLGRAALPVVALVLLAAIGGLSLASASSAGTLGYDFLAYHQAANRILSGLPLYDPSVQQTGGFGLFYYPPSFALAILPLAPIPAATAVWVWAALSTVAFLVGVAILPVGRDIRWLIVLLASLSWPFEYALKLGQVGPLLFLLFAIGWRWLDDARAIGGTAAIGALIKIQPGLVLVWAALTRRWAALAVGIVVLVVVAAVATVVVGGASAWSDFVALLRNVSDPITTPHNFTPGAVAWQLGAASDVALAIQVCSSLLALAVVVGSSLRGSAGSSYLVTVTASQLLSPVLWDHYAMLLLLPVAWLLARGQWWAIAIPLSMSVFTIGVTPPWAYPVAFWVVLVAVAVIGVREHRATSARTREPAAALARGWP
jgi:alpha-1,2-mannosyltransferase